MKKKIDAQLVGIATLAILLTLISVSAIFYDLFRNQVYEDLKTAAQLFQNLVSNQMDEEDLNGLIPEKLRITLIREDGEVEYDSRVLKDDLENHLEREEVQEALSRKEGYANRRSHTLDRDSFYYAIRLQDGSVLRVSRETENLLGIFYSAIPVIIFLALILFLLCMIFAYFLTRKLVAPIEKLAGNLDSYGQIETYEELRPFMNTIYKQHEDILKSARIRQDFTANVSHELKTPLTAISGYAQLMENGMAGTEDIRRFSHEINRNATRLLTLINDIIRLSELDSMETTLCMEPLDLAQIAQSCVENLRVNAAGHSVSIQFQGESALIQGEKDMLEELLYNLCDNAIRYNNEGGSVLVSVKKETERVVLTVQDTGIGIPEEHQERIFERFYRVDKSRSKLTGGPGLGLAIVKHIVACLNARIELWSEAGRGTRIQIFFPLAEAAR